MLILRIRGIESYNFRPEGPMSSVRPSAILLLNKFRMAAKSLRDDKVMKQKHTSKVFQNSNEAKFIFNLVMNEV